MDRVKRMSNELLERFPDKFTIDFNENKEAIKNYAQVRSKELRNKIAGYITSVVNRNLAQQNASMNQQKNLENNFDKNQLVGWYKKNYRAVEFTNK